MTNIAASDITIGTVNGMSVVEAIEALRIAKLPPSLGRPAAVKVQANPQFNINYTVSTNYVALGFTSPQSAYLSLSGQLSSFVTTNQFTTALQAAAIADGATGLEHASSTSVVTSLSYTEDISFPTASPVSAPTSDDEGLTVGAKVGIAVGVVGAVAIAGGLFYNKKYLTGSSSINENAGTNKELLNPGQNVILVTAAPASNPLL